jgi:hypothetical protein
MAGKHAVSRTTRLGWIGLAIFVLALLLAVLQKPIIRMIS